VENRIESASEYSVEESALTITTETDEVLITDEFLTGNSLEEPVPLFYKHQIPESHFDPDSGHKIVSMRLLDDSLEEVSVADYSLDSSTGTLFNNFEHEFDAGDNSYSLYYLQYTVKESSAVVKNYTVLLDNEPVYALAEASDLNEWGALINDGRKVFLREELFDGTYQFTFPSIADYAFREVLTNRIKVLPPVLGSRSDPWYIRVSNGLFYSTVDGITYKYYVPEITGQTFNPYYPYRKATKEPAAIVNKNLIKLGYDKIYEDGSTLHLDVFIYDADDYLKYAFTTDSSLHGTAAGNGRTEVVLYSNLEAGGDYGIRSVDHLYGFVDIRGMDLSSSCTAKATYYYEYSDLPINSVNFNFTQNQDIIHYDIVLFLIPDTLVSSSTQTVYLLKVDENGQVVYSDWTSFDNTERSLDGKPLFYREPPSWWTVLHGSDYSNFEETYTVNGNGYYLTLAEIHPVLAYKLDGIEDSDIRQQGGGLRGDSSLVNTEEAQSCWDVMKWDGRHYPGAGSFLVEVPSSVLSGAGGSFYSDEVREVINKHIGYGLYPVIRGYGVDPRITSVEPGDGSITVVWSHGNSDAYYKIYIAKTLQGPFTAVNDSSPVQENSTENSYTITGLENDMIYYIFVVGGFISGSTWTESSEQIIGPGNLTAKTGSTLEYVKCKPGIPRGSNFLSQRFTVIS